MYCWIWIGCLVLLFSSTAKLAGAIESKCKVTDLRVTCTSSHSVLLTWKLSPDKWNSVCSPRMYNIRWDEVGTNNTGSGEAKLTDRNHTIKGLQKGKTYKLHCVQYLGTEAKTGEQIEGSYTQLQATTQEPGAVTNIDISNVHSTSAVLYWKVNDACVHHYIVDLCPVGLSSVSKDCLHYSVPVQHQWGFSRYSRAALPSLEPCTEYNITVSAVDTDNVTSSYFSTTTFKTRFEEPGAVTHVNITAVTTDSMTVTWGPPASGAQCASGYSVALKRSGAPSYEKYLVPVTQRHINFTHLEPCTYYTVEVKANAEDKWLQQAGPTRTQSTYTTIMSNITVGGFNVAMRSASSILVSWSYPQPLLPCVQGYRVNVSSDSMSPHIEEVTNNFSTVSNLEPCTTYNVSVTVVFWGNSVSQQSVDRMILTTSPSTAQVPTESKRVQHLRVTNASVDSLSAAWESPKYGRNCVSGYYVSLLNHTGGIVYGNTFTSNTSFEFTGLKQCAPYFTIVKPQYHDTNHIHRQLEKDVMGYTLAQGNTTVGGLTVSVRSASSIDVSWSFPEHDLSCIYGYRVNISSDSMSPYIEVVTNNFSTVSNLEPCTSYYVSVTVVFWGNSVSQQSVHSMVRTTAPSTDKW